MSIAEEYGFVQDGKNVYVKQLGIPSRRALDNRAIKVSVALKITPAKTTVSAYKIYLVDMTHGKKKLLSSGTNPAGPIEDQLGDLLSAVEKFRSAYTGL